MCYCTVVVCGAKWLPGQVGVKAGSSIALRQIVHELQIARAEPTVRLTTPDYSVAIFGFLALLLAATHIRGPFNVH